MEFASGKFVEALPQTPQDIEPKRGRQGFGVVMLALAGVLA
ncbi:hypothetical protein [Sulfitobacter pacificus]|nr:hypothetical protein [Sulfitobacter pacificus]